MAATIRNAKSLALALALLTSAGVSARAADPTPAQLAAAMTILNDLGMKRSFDEVVPGMMVELEHNVTATRPELKDPLHAVIVAVVPEFAKTEQQVLDSAAKILSAQMSEQEIKEVAAFYESAAGKKYVSTQPAFFQEFSGVAQAWKQKLSSDILVRVREEMKKKGYEF